MNFSEYQRESKKTAHYSELIPSYIYTALGLAGEAGEVANQAKKIPRDDDGVITEERRKNLKKELGDILWYLANFSTEVGIDLEEVASENLEKLFSRQARGKLSGDGDNR